MNIELKNIGIISEANVVCDGLTIVTGKNNSGKTTIGRVIYAMVNASADVSDELENSKVQYLEDSLAKVSRSYRRTCFFRVSKGHRFIDPEQMTDLEFLQEWVWFGGRRYLTEHLVDSEGLLKVFYRIKDFFRDLDYSGYIDIISVAYSSSAEGELGEDAIRSQMVNEKMYQQFKMEIMGICDETINAVKNADDEERFVKTRIVKALNLEFRNQIKPVQHPSSESSIRIMEESMVLEGLRITDRIEFDEQIQYNLPAKSAIFIDNPFVLDSVGGSVVTGSYRVFPADFASYALISRHDEALLEVLREQRTDNYFDEVAFNAKYGSICKKINDIVPGDFKWIDGEYYYTVDQANLHVENLAGGSKQFSILKILLYNRHLDNKTILILDEPESHLHPEWINKFAEVIVLLVKEIGLRVLLTTHSTNLLLALDVFSRKHEIRENTHAYMVEECDLGKCAKEIDGDIAEAYAHLSLPFLEMNLEKRILDEN